MVEVIKTTASALNMSRVVGVVLGGGQGKRLYPLTAERAKPAVPLFGRYRLVDVPLSNCIHSGVNHLYVLTQYNSVSLNRHINSSYKFDGFSGGFVEVLAAEQTMQEVDWFQGTADAVRKHLRQFQNHRPQHYLILSGDQLYRMDYRRLMAAHLAAGADITVATLPVTKEEAKAFGILKVRENSRIYAFVEKPQRDEQFAGLASPPKILTQHGIKAEGREYLASMGVYLFRAPVLEEILLKKKNWIDFGRHVIPKSLRSHKVFSDPFDGFWADIGTVRSYYEVSLSMVKPNPPFTFYEADRIIYTRPRYLPGSRIQYAVINDSILCEGSRITKAMITDSIIGIRTIVQPGAEIGRTIIMGADYYEDDPGNAGIPIGIGRGARITGAIIDKNARIGRRVVIRGSRKMRDRDGDGFAVRDGIVVVLKNAVIPDGTEIA